MTRYGNDDVRRGGSVAVVVAVVVVRALLLSHLTIGASASSAPAAAFVSAPPPLTSWGGTSSPSAAAATARYSDRTTRTTTARSYRPLSLGASRGGDDDEYSDDDEGPIPTGSRGREIASSTLTALSALSVSAAVLPSLFFGAFAGPALASTDADIAKYDGFAEYAKENKMEKSDVKCFATKCGDQTKALFSNPRGIKGVSCLGRCKGEQKCATRCFAEFGSDDLNEWLSCTIEDYECVKVPKNVDNSDEDRGYDYVVKDFDSSSLIGKWYKTDGLNPNYDLFPCQSNVFTASPSSSSSDSTKPTELDMGIFLRVSRPDELGGGYWENELGEHMVIDDPKQTEATATTATTTTKAAAGRTMHTEGKMYGLKFSENWYIVGESDGKGSLKDDNGDPVPELKLVAYRGHTLQGNYDGAFVYARTPQLPESAKSAVRKMATRAGFDFNEFTRIDNTCPVTERALNDPDAGTGTSTTDWVDLVVGEGGVIDWVVPGWRGEYNKK